MTRAESQAVGIGLAAPAPEGAQGPEYSIVIPVFNSVAMLDETIAACRSFFAEQRVSYELIMVDDGSRDGSWRALSAHAATFPELVAVRLFRNYGQHTAVYCGLAYSRGRYVVTLDDDLQNPPSEIAHLMARRLDHDAVFGKFADKQHSLIRRLGSAVINRLNARIFGQPRDLVVSNFRLLRRDVVDRILAYRVREPYINGLAVLCAENPTNVVVQHRPRARGKTGYGPGKIAGLVARILFNYSALPLRALSLGGATIAVASLLLSVYFAGHALYAGRRVPGWTSLAVLLSFFNGVSLLALSMVGEYLIRVLEQGRNAPPYEVTQVRRWQPPVS